MLSYFSKLKQNRLTLNDPLPPPKWPKEQSGISAVLNKISMRIRFVSKKPK